MNNLISFNVCESCLVCNQFSDFNQIFYQLSTTYSAYSKKPLNEIFELIFNKITSEDSSICESCLSKINEYDLHTSQALKLQSDLIEIHEKAKANEYQLDNIELDAFHHMNLPNEFNFEADSNGIFFIAATANNDETEDISDEFKKVIKNEGIKYNYEVFQRAFGGDDSNNSSDLFCENCSIKFRCMTSLLIHKASDHGKIKCQIPCWICSKKCANKMALRAHLICHRDVKKYQCYCGKKFMYKISYTQHIKIHDNLREFQCNFCDFKALTKTHLQRHLRARHTKEKNHQCPHCHRSFAEKYNMKSHIRKQHSN